MKKIVHLILLIILFQFLNNCGYQPIFSEKNLDVKIVEYHIDGDLELGKKIHSRLKQLFVTSENANKNNIIEA